MFNFVVRQEQPLLGPPMSIASLNLSARAARDPSEDLQTPAWDIEHSDDCPMIFRNSMSSIVIRDWPMWIQLLCIYCLKLSLWLSQYVWSWIALLIAPVIVKDYLDIIIIPSRSYPIIRWLSQDYQNVSVTSTLTILPKQSIARHRKLCCCSRPSNSIHSKSLELSGMHCGSANLCSATSNHVDMIDGVIMVCYNVYICLLFVAGFKFLVSSSVYIMFLFKCHCVQYL